MFSPEALAKGLEAIYKGLNVRDEIEDHIFRETLRLFNEAAAKGFTDSDWPEVPDEFVNQIRTNNAIWSAFRVHRMQNDIASKLLDEDGQLKKFDRWVEDIKGMTSHYVGPWLRTEYSTAVIRAHQAADWKHFEAEADIFPNVRWMPTTSPQQDPLHRQYWEKKLTLPVNHPFWEKHRPGDRWNCKCTLQQTDEQVNDEVIKDFYPVPQEPGLDNNPGKDGKLFSNTHPYISKAYPGAKAAVEDILDEVLDFVPAQTIEEAEEFARQYCQRLGIDRTFRGEISYKGISLDNANEINRALKLVMERVDVPKISGIKPISGSSKTGRKIFKDGADAVAAYDPVSKGIYLNTDVLKSAKAFAEYQKRAQEAWDKVMSNLDKLSPEMREIAERYKKAGRSLVDPSVKGCIIHELGHHVQWTKMPADLINSIKDIAANSVKISGYAGATKGEYIAESFASWMKGEKRIAKDLQEFFDSIATTKPKKKVITKRQKTDKEKQEIRRRWEERRLYRENMAEVAKIMKMKVPTKHMDFDTANESRGNPKYLTGRSYQINCQSCVVANEMRRRGLTVSARPNTKKRDSVPYRLSYQTELIWIDPKTGQLPQLQKIYAMTETAAAADWARRTAEPGRYHLRFHWKSGGGHIITFERKEDGTGLFYDPQTGRKYQEDQFYYDRIKIDSLRFYRVDNLRVDTSMISGAVVKQKE